ncbi:hypothetical protein [Mycolicibacter sinensis]|uniref:hypothetical protein n=1 Tax=Mycolicibacter sinensis (strain JDM601) TaxID=875328 RepID=UPI0013F4C7A4|nr:hypothetical protein [Mycolicibacter sinensis]
MEGPSSVVPEMAARAVSVVSVERAVPATTVLSPPLAWDVLTVRRLLAVPGVTAVTAVTAAQLVSASASSAAVPVKTA